jgi:hypothetical protein
MSFVPTIKDLEAALKADADLAAFIAANFPGKSLTVKRVFRDREEIKTSDLPLLMLTRPSRSVEYALNDIDDDNHQVRGYFLFHESDRTIAQDLVIEGEEAIVDAAIKDPERSGLASDTAFLRSANDEGKFHPVYGVMIDLQITRRDI